jgi:hypothetical protein
MIRFVVGGPTSNRFAKRNDEWNSTQERAYFRRKRQVLSEALLKASGVGVQPPVAIYPA